VVNDAWCGSRQGFQTGWPVDEELTLLDSILYPIEAHVHGFGALLFDGAVGKYGGSRVVGLHGCGRLGMSEFDESVAKGNGVMSVEEECANFGFGSRYHDVSEELSSAVDGTLVARLFDGRFCGIFWVLVKVEVASGAATGFGHGEVGAVAVVVKDHVTGVEANDSVRMRGFIVQKVDDGIECCLGCF
jgi:hypothetical protein